METLFADLKHAFRLLRQSAGFTITAISALALGIGANTAIFSVVNAVLLKPLPFPEPDRIVLLMNSSPQGSGTAASVPKYNIWRAQSQVLEDVAAYDTGGPGMNVAGGDRPEQVKGIHVSHEFFRLFGARVVLGRTFLPEEDRPRGGHVAVLGERPVAAPVRLGPLGGRQVPDPGLGALHDHRGTRAGVRIRHRAGSVHSVSGGPQQHAARPLFPGGRPPEAGRLPESRQSRTGVGGRGIPAEISGSPWAAGQLHGGADAGDHRAQRAAGAADFAGRGGVCAADRVRECGQPAAGARVSADARDLDPRGHGRGARAHRAPTAHRERLLSLAGGLLGLALGAFGVRALLALNPREYPAHRTSTDRAWRWIGESLGFTLLLSLLDRHRLRTGSGDAGFARGSQCHAQGIGGARRLGLAAEQDAQRAGGDGDGARDRAAGGRGRC